MSRRLSSARLRALLPTPNTPVRRYVTLFDDQPQKPSVQTYLPGPRSTEGRAKLGRVFDTGAMRMLVDYENSHGS